MILAECAAQQETWQQDLVVASIFIVPVILIFLYLVVRVVVLKR